jgi:glutamate dehydrogenase/leucine dehydrogenase
VVLAKLEKKMKYNTRRVITHSKKTGLDLRISAFCMAVAKVAEARFTIGAQ